MTERGFRDPQALRRSVTDRLRVLATAEPHATLADLLRQFAYDRLLCRVFSGDGADHWVLKGATAMLVRLGSDSRHTRDVDLYSNVGNLDDAEAAFRVAAAQDMRDFFRFEVAPGVPVAGPSRTRRVRVTAYLGATRFASFPVDLVTNLNMTGTPEILGPLIRTRIPGIATTAYRVYPAADHVADKVCALLEVHDRVRGVPQPSTRYRDLVSCCRTSSRFHRRPTGRPDTRERHEPCPHWSIAISRRPLTRSSASWTPSCAARPWVVGTLRP